MKKLVKLSILIVVISCSSQYRRDQVPELHEEIEDNKSYIISCEECDSIYYIESAKVMNICFSPHPMDIDVKMQTYNDLFYEIFNGVIYKYFDNILKDTITGVEYLCIEDCYYLPIIQSYTYRLIPGKFLISNGKDTLRYQQGSILAHAYNDTCFENVQLLLGKHDIKCESLPKGISYCKILEIRSHTKELNFLELSNIHVVGEQYPKTSISNIVISSFLNDCTTESEYESIFIATGRLLYTSEGLKIRNKLKLHNFIFIPE